MSQPPADKKWLQSALEKLTGPTTRALVLPKIPANLSPNGNWFYYALYNTYTREDTCDKQEFFASVVESQKKVTELMHSNVSVIVDGSLLNRIEYLELFRRTNLEIAAKFPLTVLQMKTGHLVGLLTELENLFISVYGDARRRAGWDQQTFSPWVDICATVEQMKLAKLYFGFLECSSYDRSKNFIKWREFRCTGDPHENNQKVQAVLMHDHQHRGIWSAVVKSRDVAANNTITFPNDNLHSPEGSFGCLLLHRCRIESFNSIFANVAHILLLDNADPNVEVGGWVNSFEYQCYSINMGLEHLRIPYYLSPAQMTCGDLLDAMYYAAKAMEMISYKCPFDSLEKFRSEVRTVMVIYRYTVCSWYQNKSLLVSWKYELGLSDDTLYVEKISAEHGIPRGASNKILAAVGAFALKVHVLAKCSNTIDSYVTLHGLTSDVDHASHKIFLEMSNVNMFEYPQLIKFGVPTLSRNGIRPEDVAQKMFEQFGYCK